MKIRLQVVIDESELREIQDSAGRRGMTVSRHAFPTGDIEDMLAEITRGRQRDA